MVDARTSPDHTKRGKSRRAESLRKRVARDHKDSEKADLDDEPLEVRSLSWYYFLAAALSCLDATDRGTARHQARRRREGHAAA